MFVYIEHYNGTSVCMTDEQPDRTLAIEDGLFSTELLKRFDCG